LDRKDNLVLTHRDPWLCSSLLILIGTEPQIILQEIPDTIDGYA
jgi:hypothetical protein